MIHGLLHLDILSSSWYFYVYFWRAQAFLLHLDSPVVEEIWRFWFFMWPPIEVSREFLGGAPSSWFSNLPSFGGHEPCECGHKTFWFVTWLCGWDPVILSHHLAKFGVHRPCGSGDITFFICHVTTISKCHVTLWVESPHPKSPPC